MAVRCKRVWVKTALCLALGFLLTNCAPVAPPPVAAPSTPAASTSKPESVTPSSKPVAEAPKYGGILNVTLNADSPSFDVHQEDRLQVQATVQTCYSGLLQYKPSDPDRVIGDLAETWDASPDGMAYTFRR